jgi:Protein kinase domain
VERNLGLKQLIELAFGPAKEIYEPFSGGVALIKAEMVSNRSEKSPKCDIPHNTGPVTPERLHRIRAVYEAAVDTPAAARGAVLEREYNGHDELRQEVERLLGAREHLPEWLSGPLLGVAHPAQSDGYPTVTEPARAAKVRFHPGAHLGQRYCIVYLLGRGGMGEVYRADDLVLRQPVALKFLPAASEAALNRFRNEVRTARQISHPNVCRVYDIGEADGLTYLSME